MWSKRPLAILLLTSTIIGVAEAAFGHFGELALVMDTNSWISQYWPLYRALEWLLTVAGAITFGLISDRRGRRQGLVAAVILAGLALLAFAARPVAPSVGEAGQIGAFVVVAALHLALGGAMAAGLAWIFECALRDRRGSFVARWDVAALIGAAASLFVSLGIVAAVFWLLDVAVTSSTWTWRIPILVAVALLLPVAIMLRRLPEPDQPAPSRSLSPWVIVLSGMLAAAGTAALSRLHDGYTDSYFTLERLKAVVDDTSYNVVNSGGSFIAMIAGTLLGGWLADRFGYRLPIVGGMLASIAVTAATAFAVSHVDANIVIAGMSALSTGLLAFVFPGLVVAIAGQVQARIRATALGIMLSVPVALLGLISRLRGRGEQTTTDLVIYGAIVVTGLVAMWILTSRREEHQPTN